MASLFASCFSSDAVVQDLTQPELKERYHESVRLNDGRLLVRGILAKADCKTSNNRIYPEDVLRREVTSYKKEYVECGLALGEADHPDYSSPYFKFISFANISHQVIDMNWKGKDLWGTIEVLPTPSGLMIFHLFSEGLKLGVSLRGWSTVWADPDEGAHIVQQDFELVAFDFVPVPSVVDAYLMPITKKYKRHIPNMNKFVHLASTGYGAVEKMNLKRMPLPKDLLGGILQQKVIFRERSIEKKAKKQKKMQEEQMEIEPQQQENDVPCVQGVIIGRAQPEMGKPLLLAGSYIVHNDLIARKKKETAPGTRQHMRHLTEFMAKTLRNNEVVIQQHGQ